jgi:hypothetical protein
VLAPRTGACDDAGVAGLMAVVVPDGVVPVQRRRRRPLWLDQLWTFMDDPQSSFWVRNGSCKSVCGALRRCCQ